MNIPPAKFIAVPLFLILAFITVTGTAFASPALRPQTETRQNAARFANVCGSSYKAVKGDTIDGIAAKCGLDRGIVLAANGGRTKVKAGRVLHFKTAPAPTPTSPPRVIMPKVQRPPRPTAAPPIDREDKILPTPTAPAAAD
jgi:hypothetical protein